MHLSAVTVVACRVVSYCFLSCLLCVFTPDSLCTFNGIRKQGVEILLSDCSLMYVMIVAAGCHEWDTETKQTKGL